MNDARFIERWIERKRLKAAQLFADKNKADGNNQVITPFAPKINERSLWLRQQLTITDVLNSIAPSDKERAQELYNLGINPNDIAKIIIAQRPKEFATLDRHSNRKNLERKRFATIYYPKGR